MYTKIRNTISNAARENVSGHLGTNDARLACSGINLITYYLDVVIDQLTTVNEVIDRNNPMSKLV